MDSSKQLDDELMKSAHELFTTEAGIKFLELLREKFLMAPNCDYTKPDYFAYVRAGENYLVQQLSAWVEGHQRKINWDMANANKPVASAPVDNRINRSMRIREW